MRQYRIVLNTYKSFGALNLVDLVFAKRILAIRVAEKINQDGHVAGCATTAISVQGFGGKTPAKEVWSIHKRS